jgi:hypothetical protein
MYGNFLIIYHLGINWEVYNQMKNENKNILFNNKK